MSDRQIPGQPFTFKCGHRAMLPATKGEGNAAAYWRKQRTDKSSSWGCRPCYNEYLTAARQTPKGWARTCLWQANAMVRRDGIVAPKITVEELVALSGSAHYCIACGHQFHAISPDRRYKKKRAFERRQLHHNHETGEVIGFVHNHCNMAEGYLSRIPSVEGKRQFMKVFVPRSLTAPKHSTVKSPVYKAFFMLASRIAAQANTSNCKPNRHHYRREQSG